MNFTDAGTDYITSQICFHGNYLCILFGRNVSFLQKTCHLRFSKMFLLNSLNSVTKILVITVKAFEPVNCFAKDQHATTEPARHMSIEPNSCLSDLSDSLNSLNSCSIRVYEVGKVANIYLRKENEK